MDDLFGIICYLLFFPLVIIAVIGYLLFIDEPKDIKLSNKKLIAYWIVFIFCAVGSIIAMTINILIYDKDTILLELLGILAVGCLTWGQQLVRRTKSLPIEEEKEENKKDT